MVEYINPCLQDGVIFSIPMVNENQILSETNFEKQTKQGKTEKKLKSKEIQSCTA